MDTALILAGGRSSRFGGPKALVRVGRKPMVVRVVDAVAPLAGEVVVSVASRAMADSLTTTCPDAVFAVDRRHNVGPIEGILRGFEAAHGARVLVAPCDAPLLRPALYGLLLASLGDHEAAVPRVEVLDPVRAVYRRSAVLQVLAQAKDPLPSPSSLVDRLDAVFVGPDQIRAVDPHLDSFVDVNRHEDLVEVRSRLRRG